MGGINRDAVVAIGLLLLCATFFWASFDIREMGYASIGAEVWPRLILLVLFALSSLYLFQSLRRGGGERGGRGALGRLARRYRNALWCYGLFLAFLLTLPWLGMLIGGSLFVFAALTVMGPWTPRAHLTHAVIAIGTIGAMWALFTFGLRVILPQGALLRVW